MFYSINTKKQPERHQINTSMTSTSLCTLYPHVNVNDAFAALVLAHNEPEALLRIKAGVDVTEPQGKDFVLWFVANHGLYECARALLKAGAHPETTRDNMPLLWMLTGAGGGGRAFVFDEKRRALCEELVQRGARVDAPGLNGRTALECCSRWGHVEAVRFLLAHGARVRSDGFFETAPLVGAAGESRLEIVKMLLEAGADPNASHGDGYTPLHAVADEDGSVPVAHLLLEAGADRKRHWVTPRYPLKRGATPLQIAKKRKLTTLAAALS